MQLNSRIFPLLFLATVSASPQAPATSVEVMGHAPGEGEGFKGFLSVLLYSGEMPKSPMDSYKTLYGVIQNQINNQLNNHYTSKLIQSMDMLFNSLNDQMFYYIQQTEKATNDSIAAGKNISGDSAVDPSFVDKAMKGIDDLLSISLDWYQPPSFDPVNPSAFILADIKGLGSNICLHTQSGSVKPGTNVVVDTACDLDSYDDKVWGIGPDNRLILRTNLGDMCVAYKDDDGNSQNSHLAIFSIVSPACSKSRFPIRLLQAKDGSFSIYDGNVMMCIQKPKWHQFMAKIPVIVNPLKFKCYNDNFMQFQSRIPVNINVAGAGGSTGNSITPPRSFSEIGVQVYYFPLIASVHIAAMQEMFQYGTLKQDALAKFNMKVDSYMTWLAAFVPMFDSYSIFVGIDSTQQINQAYTFFMNLQNTTIA